MGNGKFWKNYISSFLSTFMVFTTVANPLATIVSNAEVLPTTEQTVTVGSSKQAIFTHKHATNGEYQTGVEIDGQTYNGYSEQSACFYPKVEHEHTEECKEYKLRYTLEVVSTESKTPWEYYSASDPAFAIYNDKTNPKVMTAYRTLMENDPDSGWVLKEDGTTDEEWFATSKYRPGGEVDRMMQRVSDWGALANYFIYFDKNDQTEVDYNNKYRGPYTLARNMWAKRAQANDPDAGWHDLGFSWHSANKVIVGDTIYRVGTTKMETSSSYVLMYYDHKEEKFVGNQGNPETIDGVAYNVLFRDEESPFSIPDLLYKPYYWTGVQDTPSSETYWTGNYICNPNGPIYVNDCNTEEDAQIAIANVSADAENNLSYSISLPASTEDTNLNITYTVEFLDPSGTVVKTDNGTVSTTEATGSFECTEAGQYKVRITVKSQAHDTIIDNDTAIFNFTPSALNCTVNFYDDDGTTLLDSTTTMKNGEEDQYTPFKPSKTGHNFRGYYTALTGGTRRYNGTPAVVSTGWAPVNGGVVNLYAQYAPKNYTVNYVLTDSNENPDAVAPTSDTAVYNSTYTAKDANVYDGYTFDGWYANQNLTGQKYTSGTIKGNLTLYGKYVANSHTVTYLPGNGNEKENAVMPSDEVVKFGSSHTPASATSYTGYTFDGWYTNINCTGTKYTGSTISGDLTLYGKYTARNQTVRYVLTDANEYADAVVPANETVKYDSSYTAKAANIYEGYTFTGWYTNSDLTGTRYTTGTIKGNLTLYGKYTANDCTVHYALGTGNEKTDAIMPEDQAVKFGSAHTPSSANTYTGYDFDGWYLAEDCSGQKYTGSTIAGDLTLYGKYTAKDYTVTYALGTGNEKTDAEVPTNDTVKYGTEYTAKDANQYNNYTFNGWYLDENCTGDKYTGSTISGDLTLYGKYTANNKNVKYALVEDNEKADAVVPSKDVVKYGSTYTAKAANQYEGYTFDGWYKNAALTNKFTTGVITGNTTLYGKYTANDQTVHYVLTSDNECTSAQTPADETVKYNSEYTAKDANIYEGYTFTGWYENEDLTGTKYTTGTIAGNLTLYGKYTANNYTVSYEFGTGNEKADAVLPGNETVKFGSLHTPASATAYTGYTFDGWYTNENCTGTKYTGSTILGDLTLYGKYTANNQTVSYALGTGNQKADAAVPSPDTVKYNSEYIPKSANEYNNYAFDGWYLTEDCTGDKYTGGVVKNDFTLYGKYIAGKKNVNYALGTGNEKTDAQVPASDIVTVGTQYTPKNANVYEGYTFDGWYENEACTGNKYTGSVIENNLTLYGKYTANNQNVSYVLTSESEYADAVVPTPDVVKYGTSYTAKAANTYEGYTFTGWYTNENLSGDKYTTGTIDGDLILYGKYTANDYVVQYSAGTGNEYASAVFPSSDNVKYGQMYTAKSANVYEGYTFDGWYLTEDCTGDKFSRNTITGNITLYGKYTANECTITYALGTGNEKTDAAVPSADTAKYSTLYTPKAATKYTGYTFDGWYTTVDCSGTKYTSADKIAVLGDITLYGKYIADGYVVNYQAGTGNEKTDATFPSSDTVKYDSSYTAKSANTYDGYAFDGWYTSENCTGDKYTTGTIKGNLTLYGKYTANELVVTYAFGDDNENADITLPSADTVKYNTGYTAKEATTVENYVFDGWYTNKACTTKFVNGTEITEDTVLYGKYTANGHVADEFTVNYVLTSDNEKADAVIPGNETVGYGTTYTAKEATVYEGYTFTGWYENENLTGQKYTSNTITGSLVLYGKYTANDQTVHYAFTDENEYSSAVAPADETVKYDSQYTAKSANTYTGYTFDGWYENANLTGEKYTTGTIKGDLTLYGKYTANDQIVKYKFGTGNELSTAVLPEQKIVKFGSDFTPDNANTYDGYTFDGWYTTEDCTGDKYTGSKINSDLTLYGKYTANDQTVHYVLTSANEKTDATVPADETVKFDSEYTAKTATTYEGYTFTGWYENEDLTGTKYTTGTIEGDLVLYGKYTAEDCAIDYALGTGNEYADAAVPEADIVKYDSTYTAKNANTYDGYTFDGWYLSEDCTGDKYTSGTVNGSFTLYGKYTANDYTVVYHIVGDNSIEGLVVPSNDTVKFGSSYTAKDANEYDGYTFNGWYSSRDLSGQRYTTGTISGNLDLYGEYVANNQTVHYELTNANEKTDATVPANETVKFDSAYTAKDANTYTGYTFTGWYTNSNLTGTKYTSGTIKGDLTLYGKYTANNCTINYQAGSGNEYADAVFPTSETAKYDSDFTPATANTYEGYTFDGWYTNEECTGDKYTGGKIAGDLTLYGKYTANDQNVHYVLTSANEKEGAVAPADDTVKFNQEYTAKDANVYEGYGFSGWYENEDLTGTKYTKGTINGDLVLYGKYTAGNQTVSYALGTGNEKTDAVVPEDETVKYSTLYTPKAATEYTGYTFDGWYITVDCTGTKYTSTDKIAVLGDITLYGKYIADDCAVNYQAGTGNEKTDATFPSSDMVKYDSSYTAKLANTYDGYTFDGWYTSEDCSGDKFTSDTIKGNLTLYGKYTANDQTVHYILTSENEYADAVVPEDETVKFGSSHTAKTANRYEGYTFTGWYDNENLTGTKYTTGTIDGDLTLYGKYTAEDCTINYAAGTDNEYTSAVFPSSDTAKYDSTYTAKSANTYTGYTFDGWYLTENCTGDKYTSGTVKGDFTLYGKYTANDQTIKYAFGTGNEYADAVLPADETVKYDSDFTPAEANTYDGYAFDGWYLTEDCSGDKYTGSKISSDLTLYGKYTANDQSVKYQLTQDNEKENATVPSNETVKFDSEYTAKTATTYTGYTFTGWYDNENLTGTKYTTGIIKGDLVLYGKYTANVQTVHYVLSADNEKVDAVAPSDDTVKYGDTYTAKEAAVYEGYAFDGWYLDENCTGEKYTSRQIDGDITLYGKYIAGAQTITYKLGTNNEYSDAEIPAPDVVKYGTNHTPKSATTYTGYTFDGWYTTEDCTGDKYIGSVITKDITLYGNYIADIYEVSYTFGTGNENTLITLPQTENVKYNTEYTTKAATVAEGYTFDGWYTDENCITKFVDGTKITKNTVLYGKYVANELEILYAFGNDNEYEDESVLPSNDTIKYNTEYTAKTANTTTGYTFNGWYTNEECTDKFIDGTAIKENIVLYGNYIANEYEVSYSFGNDNENTAIDLPTSDNVKYNTEYTAKEAVLDENYNFNGWYIDKACTTKFTDGTKITENIVLYGNYIAKEYKITYDFGTTNENPGVVLPSGTTIKYNTEYTSEKATVYTGYTFDGWYTDENCTTKFVDGTKITKETVLYGNYIADTYEISYAFGAGNENTDVTLPTPEIIKYNTAYTTKNAQTVANYVFDGWYTDKACTTKFVNGTKITDNIVLYGKYILNAQTIKYVLVGDNNPDVNIDSDIVKFGTKYTAKTPPTVKHFEFDGWYTDENCTIKFVDGTVIESDITLYGKYNEISYKVFYNTDEGAPTDKNIKVFYDEKYSVPESDVKLVPVKSGMEFKGWFLKDGTKIFNPDGSSVASVYKYTTDIYVYAKFEPSSKNDTVTPAPQPPSNNNTQPPAPAEQKDKVKTGDENNIALFLVLMAVFTATGAFVIVKKKEEE